MMTKLTKIRLLRQAASRACNQSYSTWCGIPPMLKVEFNEAMRRPEQMYDTFKHLSLAFLLYADILEAEL